MKFFVFLRNCATFAAGQFGQLIDRLHNHEKTDSLLPLGRSGGFRRTGGNISYDDGELYDAAGDVIAEPEIVACLGDSLYQATYVGAHGQYETGMRLIKIGAPVMAGGLTLFGVGLIIEATSESEGGDYAFSDANMVMMAFGLIAAAAGETCLSVGIPFASIGKARLKWLAEDYNSRSGLVAHRSVQPYLQIGACRHGYGLALNF